VGQLQREPDGYQRQPVFFGVLASGQGVRTVVFLLSFYKRSIVILACSKSVSLWLILVLVVFIFFVSVCLCSHLCLVRFRFEQAVRLVWTFWSLCFVGGKDRGGQIWSETLSERFHFRLHLCLHCCFCLCFVVPCLSLCFGFSLVVVSLYPHS